MSRLKFILELINKANACTSAEIGQFVMQNTSLVDNNKATQIFLQSIKKKISSTDIFGINEEFLKFSKEFIFNTPLNILFIGSSENYSDFLRHRTIPDLIKTHSIQTKDIPLIKPLISEIKKDGMIVFYDRESLSTVQDIIADTVSYLYTPYSELKYLLDLQINRLRYRTLHHYSLNKSLSHYLENESISQVVIGSSYPWAAFPQEILKHSTNISMHCADLTFTRSVLAGLQSKKTTKSAVLLLSPYDLYYELSLSRNNDILSTFNALKNFCREHNFEYNTTRNFMYEYIFTQYNHLITPEIFPLFILDTLFLKEDIRKELFDKIEFIKQKNITPLDPPSDHTLHYVQNDLKRKHSRDFKTKEEHIKSCYERATKHSRHFNYKDSHPINVNNINALISLAKKNEMMINVIMSPFPKEYLHHLDKNMITGSRNFFTSIQSRNFRFIDLLDNEEFINSDFYDGDHLNFSGAEKICKHLNKLGIIL